jgi:cell wall assembly regulator SMI1
MSIDEVIKELSLFSNRIITLNEPGNLEDIELFENTLGLKLPNDYKELLKIHNGFDLMGATIYGIGNSSHNRSLEKIHKREHTEVANPLYECLVPFSPDGGGNHYCFDTRTINEGSCNIIFWQHDYPYAVDDPPEITNASFVEWVKEVIIDWTLEDYNYDGSEK